MKIALLTIWHEKNFGAEMQCYATVKALQHLGHEVEVIDYRLSDNLHKPFKHKLLDFIRLFSPETRGFDFFWHKYIPTTRHYQSEIELKKDPPLADIYMTGSDQVWNPDITKEKWATFFLNFGDDSVKRISYAPSFGEDRRGWPEKEVEASRLLHRYEHVSVREKSGEKLLSRQFNIPSTCVLDPTLLHQDYEELSPVAEYDVPTLVYYPLVPNLDLEAFAEDIAHDIGVGFINTNRRTHLLNKITWERTHIRQWLGNIKNSAMVVTPSFHGLAFSLIFKRQFIVVQNAHGKNRSSRITGLLHSLGLDDRYFSSIEDARSSRVWERPIDYSEVTPKLDAIRKTSWDYLKQSLK